MITNTKITFGKDYLITNDMFIKNHFIAEIIPIDISKFKKIVINNYKNNIITLINKLNENEKIKCQHLLIYMNKFINIIIKKKIHWHLTVDNLTKIFSLINNYLQLNDFEFNLFIRNTIDINLFPKNTILNLFKDSYSDSFTEIMQHMLGNDYKKSVIWNNVPQSNRIIELCTHQEIASLSLFIEINQLILSKLDLIEPLNLRNVDLKQYYNNKTFYHGCHRSLLKSLFNTLNKSKKHQYNFNFENHKNLTILKEENINNSIKIINKNNKIVILSFYDPIQMENCSLENYSNYFILKQPQLDNNKEYYNIINFNYPNIDDFLNKLNHIHPINRASISKNDTYSIIDFFNYIYNY